MEFVVDKLIDFSAGKDEELRDISGLGMRSFLCYAPTSLTVRNSFENDHVGTSTRGQDRDKGLREAYA